MAGWGEGDGGEEDLASHLTAAMRNLTHSCTGHLVGEASPWYDGVIGGSGKAKCTDRMRSRFACVGAALSSRYDCVERGPMRRRGGGGVQGFRPFPCEGLRPCDRMWRKAWQLLVGLWPLARSHLRQQHS